MGQRPARRRATREHALEGRGTGRWARKEPRRVDPRRRRTREAAAGHRRSKGARPCRWRGAAVPAQRDGLICGLSMPEQRLLPTAGTASTSSSPLLLARPPGSLQREVLGATTIAAL